MYYSDKPINSNGDDQLGRHGFAKLLAKSLLNLDSRDTFSIGLFGKWGSGKTSIVNMMLQEIEVLQKDTQDKKKLIVVHFEPWNFSNTDQLLTQFFIRLSSQFRNSKDKHMKEIGEALERYSGALDFLTAIPYVGKALSIFGKQGVVVASKKLKKGSDEKDISKQKEYVIGLLKEQSSKILVVIDDIDRLSNEQIRQVFQLVTSVAKFPNTIYLLVFDRAVVVKALKKVQEGNGEDYLEKIIQMPIQIPESTPEKLKEVLLERLVAILSDYEGTGFQKHHWQNLYEPCVVPFVDSIRTANRLCNVIQFKLAGICTEIDFADFVSLSAMELQFPEVYKWIRGNKSVLTGEYDLSGVINSGRTQQDWCKIYSSELHDLLQKNRGDVNDDQVEEIITSISHLFPYFGQKIGKTFEAYNLNVLRKNNQIAHPEKFDRYFCFDLDEIPIKKSELMKAAFVLNCDEFVEFGLEQEDKGASYEFLEEIRAITPELPSARAKTIVMALLAICYRLDTYSQKNILYPQSSALAEYMMIELLEKVDLTERFQFVCDIISGGDVPVLESIASVINILELGYGRLAANGKEQGYKKALTLDELIQVERIFTDKIEQVLSECNLFDFDRWQMVYYLLENFDGDYAKTYLEVALKDDANIVKYVAASISAWTGGGTEYEVRDSYQSYLTDERVLEAIEALRTSGKLYLMSEKIQSKCVAFYLNATNGERNYHGNIAQGPVDELLALWQQSS